MALITCSECGGQVSSTAAACPHCGAPVSAASAVEERKCEECGAILPEGAEACPNCGCPAETAQAQPAAAQQPAYIAPTVAPAPAPARVQLGSAKLRIVEDVARKTSNANVWIFFATAVAFVLYIIAFVRYMGFFTKAEDFKKDLIGGFISWGADKLTEGKATEFFNACTTMKWVVIGVLVIAALTFIGELGKIEKKELMSACSSVGLVLAVGGFWIPVNVMSSFTGIENDTILGLLDFFTNDGFGTFLKVAPWIIAGLSIISFIVCAAVPKVTDFCSSCGRNIKHDGVGGVCKGCGERKYIPGFTPIPRDVVAAYPYSGETLVGKSPVRKTIVLYIVLIDIACVLAAILPLFLGAADGNAIAVIVALGLLALGILITTIFAVRGVSDKIIVTPTSVKLRSITGSVSLNVPISDITDILTNEAGDLAICARGKGAIFTDISNRTQIAAALASLTNDYQMN